MTIRNLSLFWIALGGLAVVGCQQGPEYAFEQLDLQRYGWDSLSVAAQFNEQLLLGRTRPIEPQEVVVYLFNASYDTLYAGDGRLVPIADRELGNRERLMLEVCGRFAVMTVCEQEAVTASPKRLRVDHDIDYPEGWAFQRGRYELDFTAERQTNDSTWERLGPAKGVEGHLRAYVGDEAQEAIKIPFTSRRGRFNLEGKPHFNDFHYHLTSALMDSETAAVHFDIYAGLAGWPVEQVASVMKSVREKTEEERAQEVAYFVDQATEALLVALDLPEMDWFDSPDSTAWTFNTLTDTYRVKMELAWGRRGRLFRRHRAYQLGGVLEVEAQGTNARFTRQTTNERTARYWAFTIGEPTLPLGTLEPYPYEEDDEDGE